MQGRVTISNDGATIMKLLDIVHPAAKVLADISMSQDAEVSQSAISALSLAHGHAAVSCHTVHPAAIWYLHSSTCFREKKWQTWSIPCVPGVHASVDMWLCAGWGWHNHSGHPSRRAFEGMQSLHRRGCTSSGIISSPINMPVSELSPSVPCHWLCLEELLAL